MFKDVVVLVSVLLSMTFAQTQKDVYNDYEGLNDNIIFNSSSFDDSEVYQLKIICDSIVTEIVNKNYNNCNKKIAYLKQEYLKQELNIIKKEIKEKSEVNFKENYPFYDLTLKNKKKIKGVGFLFATLGTAGIVNTMVMANTGTEWKSIYTVNLCYSTVFLFSGLAITINY